MDYLSNIVPDDYIYAKEITVTEPGYADRSQYNFLLSFNNDNFNFDLVQSTGIDIRVAENSNGSSVLPMWIATWSYDLRKGDVWLKIPNISKYEVKTLYVFFGNDSVSNVSDGSLLNFIFYDDFNFSPLVKWGGDASSTLHEVYGYPISQNSDDYISLSSTNVFQGQNSWITETGWYNLDDSWSSTHRSYKYTFNGTNGFYVEYTSGVDENFQSDMVDSSTNVYYSDGGLAPLVYFKQYIAYDEERDRVYVGQSERVGYDDYLVWAERKVEGNTVLTYPIITGFYNLNGSGAYPTYLRWFVVREYVRPSRELTIDTSNLKVGYEHIGYQSVDIDAFSEDLTSITYYHLSDAGGDPYKLSDDTYVNVSDSFYSEDTTSGSVFIDFGRGANKVNSMDYVHFDSSHNYHYNAAKLSEIIDGDDIYGRSYWQATTSSGWACIDFYDTNKTITCVGLKKNTLNGVPLDLKIQGGFGDPRKSDTEWKDLLVSSGKNSTGWQVFYLNNRNPYRYYRLYITSTQDGSNIRLDEWVLYEGIDVEKRIVSQLRLRPLDKDAQEIYFPKEIYVYGSMDFDGWTLLGSFSTYTPLYDGPYGRWQRYDLGNTVGYWAYKLTFVGNWNSTADKVAIAEWEMVQKTDTIPTYSILYGDHEEINSIYADPDTTFDDGWVYTGSYMVTYVHDDKTVNYSYIGTLLMDINTL